MQKKRALAPAPNLATHRAVVETLSEHIIRLARPGAILNILEAGCGSEWRIRLKDIPYTLTGVDQDAHALDIRKNTRRDLDIAIVADLQTVSLAENAYDVVYCENVLEHIRGAEGVLDNFIRWLKPGGLMILRFPNRDAAYSFVTRMTPFAAHVFYKKYVQGMKTAGQPGHDPYPVFFDPVISRNGTRDFCKRRGLVMRAEYRTDSPPIRNRAAWLLAMALLWGLRVASLGRLSVDHRNLAYVIEKPAR